MITLDHDTIIRQSSDQVSCGLGDEAAILNISARVYHGLNPVGARIWSLIERPMRLEAVKEMLLAEYEVDAGRCDEDLRQFVGELAEAGLIDITNEPAEAAVLPAV